MAQFSILLVDVRMPGMDGPAFLDVCGQVRPQMRVIIIAGHGDQEMSREAVTRGAAGFLSKPLGLGDLELCLNQLATGWGVDGNPPHRVATGPRPTIRRLNR